MRLCQRCKKEKNESDFHKSTKRGDGFQLWCKMCFLEYGRSWARELYARTGKKKSQVDEWRKKHPGRAKEIAKAYNKRLRLLTFSAYGGESPKCTCCGESEVLFLTIDHIDGGGAKHRREIGATSGCSGRAYSGVNFYKWLKRNGFPKGFQVLCYNCNCSKGFFGKCPHQK